MLEFERNLNLKFEISIFIPFLAVLGVLDFRKSSEKSRTFLIFRTFSTHTRPAPATEATPRRSCRSPPRGRQGAKALGAQDVPPAGDASSDSSYVARTGSTRRKVNLYLRYGIDGGRPLQEQAHAAACPPSDLRHRPGAPRSKSKRARQRGPPTI